MNIYHDKKVFVMRNIKKLVPRQVVEELCEFRYKLNSAIHYVKNIKQSKELKNKHKIIYLMTPTHRNIGDAAIALGAFELYKRVFPDLEIIEFTDSQVQNQRYFIKTIVNNNDLVFLHGGGNLGDWYPAWELLRQDVIKLLKDKRVVLMPQTISFGNRKDCQWILKKAIRTYRKYELTKFICRDRKSKTFAREVLCVNNIGIMPDSALNIPRMSKGECVVGKKITLCLRQDIEKNRTDDFDSLIYSLSRKYARDVLITDTIACDNITPDIRKKIVMDKILELRGSDLVITDRYHGVIFSYLANCPCLVLANRDDKVKEAMYFFERLPYIKFLDNADDLEQTIQLLLSKDTSQTEDFFKMYFQEFFVNEVQKGLQIFN